MPVGLAHLMHGADVRVVERRREPRFAQQPGAGRVVVQRLGGQDLDGDFAPELGVARAVHLAHAARAERGEDLVVAETSACGQRHRVNVPQAPDG